jgi:hypothetical protein
MNGSAKADTGHRIFLLFLSEARLDTERNASRRNGFSKLGEPRQCLVC